MVQKNDQVFQLSLTEIAFTIAFLLLLLLGYIIHTEQKERAAAEAKLAKAQSAEQATKAMDDARQTLAGQLLGAGVTNPDETITRLIDAGTQRAENAKLQQQVEDLDAKLTALEALQKRLDKAKPSDQDAITRDEVAGALALQGQVRAAAAQDSAASASGQPNADTPGTPAVAAVAKAASAPPLSTKEAVEVVRRALGTHAEFRQQVKDKLGQSPPAGTERQAVRDVVDAARKYASTAKPGQDPQALKTENSDLRGQVAFLKNRLDARGGRDYPPCWADESGKVEFLFSIELRADSVVVTPAWPARREGAAKNLPGIDGALAGPHSNQAFVSNIQGIFNWSKTQDPECRHYVLLKSSIADAVQSDRARLMVENYFYKVEARR